MITAQDLSNHPDIPGLKNYLDRHPIGLMLMEKALIRLTRNDFEPDVVFWKKEKSDIFEKAQMVFISPDFAVEALSPSSQVRDRKIKFTDYARHGVDE